MSVHWRHEVRRSSMILVFVPSRMNRKFPDPVRHLLPDDAAICSAYEDLCLDNTMVLGEPGSSRMAGVVDWDQAGLHWEFGSETVHSDSDYLSLERQK